MHKYLLDNRLAPLTFRWGFLEAPLELVKDAFMAWLGALSISSRAKPFRGELADGLKALEPLTLPPRKDLLLQTHSSWTAYFNNSALGGDPRSAVSHLSRVLGCRGLVVCCKPQTWSASAPDRPGTDGAVTLTLLSPHDEECLNIIRDVGVTATRGAWRFASTGQVQSFERPEVYNRRKVADRFTPGLLEEYCAALGIRLFDASSYGPQGMLVDLEMALPPRAQLTLPEARAKAGLQ